MNKKPAVQHQRDRMPELPHEIHDAIFFLVDPWRLSGAAAVSREWRDLVYAFYARHPKWAPSHEAQALFENEECRNGDPRIIMRFACIKVSRMLPKALWHKFEAPPPKFANGRYLDRTPSRVPERHRYKPTKEGQAAFEIVRQREKQTTYDERIKMLNERVRLRMEASRLGLAHVSPRLNVPFFYRATNESADS